MFIFLVDGYLSQSARLQILRSVVYGVGDIPVIVCPNKPAELFAVQCDLVNSPSTCGMRSLVKAWHLNRVLAPKNNKGSCLTDGRTVLPVRRIVFHTIFR